MKNCKSCGKEHDGSFGSGSYCNRKCSNKRSWSEEDRLKKSQSAKQSQKVMEANRLSNTLRRKKVYLEVICSTCGNEIERPKKEHTSQYYCDWKCYSASPLINKGTGGLRKGSGRGKSGWYKGYWCDSSWELAWVIFQLDRGIPFSRNLEGFEYIFQNKSFRYYPDFIVNGRYVEIKGYQDEKCKSKISQFPHELTILTKKEIAPYITYTEQKYGKDFISLYEENS